jgi:hypothetical protein
MVGICSNPDHAQQGRRAARKNAFTLGNGPLRVKGDCRVAVGLVRKVREIEQQLLYEAIPPGSQVPFRTADREFPEFGNGGAQT